MRQQHPPGPQPQLLATAATAATTTTVAAAEADAAARRRRRLLLLLALTAATATATATATSTATTATKTALAIRSPTPGLCPRHDKPGLETITTGDLREALFHGLAGVSRASTSWSLFNWGFGLGYRGRNVCRFYPASRYISCVLSLVITQPRGSSPKQEKASCTGRLSGYTVVRSCNL